MQNASLFAEATPGNPPIRGQGLPAGPQGRERGPELSVERFVAAVLPRNPRLDEEWMQDYMPPAKLAGKLNRRVMPEFMTVTDEPTLTNTGQSVGPSMY